MPERLPPNAIFPLEPEPPRERPDGDCQRNPGNPAPVFSIRMPIEEPQHQTARERQQEAENAAGAGQGGEALGFGHGVRVSKSVFGSTVSIQTELSEERLITKSGIMNKL